MRPCKRRLLIVTNRFHPELGGAEMNIFLQSQELGKYFDVEVLEDRELCLTMGVNGRRLVEEKFLYPHLIHQYMDAYRAYGGIVP